uniref:(California timema) hypothetical protein n=1 Tax=Timema californicum TaxID=61474 RepID=A0A7R9P9Y6_TIMCA|nr:unnamed protein product [Timema californicum]
MPIPVRTMIFTVQFAVGVWQVLLTSLEMQGQKAFTTARAYPPRAFKIARAYHARAFKRARAYRQRAVKRARAYHPKAFKRARAYRPRTIKRKEPTIQRPSREQGPNFPGQSIGQVPTVQGQSRVRYYHSMGVKRSRADHPKAFKRGAYHVRAIKRTRNYHPRCFKKSRAYNTRDIKRARAYHLRASNRSKAYCSSTFNRARAYHPRAIKKASLGSHSARFGGYMGYDASPSVLVFEGNYLSPGYRGSETVYDHLTDLLNKIISEQPENVVEYFEEYSRKLKESRFRPETDHLQDVYVPPEDFELAKKLMPMFEVISLKEEAEAEEEGADLSVETTRPDLMELMFFFEQAGVGLPRHEMFLIALAINKLSQSQPVEKVRFWGRILGTKKNYIIAESEFTEEELGRRAMEADLVSESNPGPENNDKGADVVELEGGSEVRKPPPKLPPIPQSVYKPPREIPPEKIGIGANKKVYFVCNNPGDDWTMLPDVTPQQINVARQIKKYFTGDLNTEILTYPPFPGTEMNYLRAQIARISAGTQVSPLGFYYFDEEEEEDEEEEFLLVEEDLGKKCYDCSERFFAAQTADSEVRTSYVENPDFEPVPLKDLLDKSMSFWVHHTLYILKQGRTTWWSPKSEEEAEEEEEEELENVSEEEVGPPILTPLSEDATLESVPPWTVRISSQLMPDFAVAVLRSNLWPGAHTFATGRKFENVYFGWGHKYTSYNYSPPTLEATQKTYPLGPEIMEMEDPTPEEEEAWRIAHEPKPEVLEEEQEEEEDMEEENEDDDDDED